jgi:3-deoxy-D-manno-octulosonate 8-phosphate phosphatase (KDO 8-P phosphatase)
MTAVLIDASTAPPDTLARRILGVPLFLWPLRALRHVMPLDRVAVMTSDPGIIGLASRHGVYPIPPSPATRSAPGLLIDPLQPFIAPATLAHALADAEGNPKAVSRLAASQTAALERFRIEDEDSFLLVASLARGLPPEHPVIDGIARLRLPLGVDIRLVVCDVDGTLTEGGVTLDHSPHASRTFHTHDGLGTLRLLEAGIKVAWLSATSSGESIQRRASMLNVTHVDAGEGPKGARFLAICRALSIEPRHALYIGDDVNDLPAIEAAALSACPADARPEVRNRVDLVLDAPGGRGAFRELADILLAGLPRTLPAR